MCAVVIIFYSFAHPLYLLYGMFPERFRHRQFFTIIKRYPLLISAIKFVPKYYARFFEFIFPFAPPSSPIRKGSPAILTSAIFFDNQKMPPTNICNKICRQRICAVARIYIRSRTRFILYTEGFRSDFDIGNFFI